MTVPHRAKSRPYTLCSGSMQGIFFRNNVSLCRPSWPWTWCPSLASWVLPQKGVSGWWEKCLFLRQAKEHQRVNQGESAKCPWLSHWFEIVWRSSGKTEFLWVCSRHPEAEGRRWVSQTRQGSWLAWLKPHFRVNRDTTAVGKVTDWIGSLCFPRFQVILLDFRGCNLNLRPGTIESGIRNRETRMILVTLVLVVTLRTCIFLKILRFFF